MDTAPTITCVEWCFGYGGNHLGLKRVLPGLRCIAASEIEAYAIANLVAKIEAGLLEPFPIWTDVKTFPCELFRDLVDIFIASYPCQPFSSSGKRKGSDDPRHLWPFVRRAIEIIRPRYVFLENVEGHVSLGLREVLTELALLGYRVENSRGEPTWGIFSAAETGAPQNRKRVFILAKREGVAQGDTLCQQTERFYTRGFFNITARAGGVDLVNAEGGRDGSVSTRPGNERIGTTESDRASQGVGLADASSATFSTRQGNNGTRRPQQRPAKGSSIVGLADDTGERFGKERSEFTGRQRESAPVLNGDVGDGQAIANSGGCGQDRWTSELWPDGIKQSSGDSRQSDTRQWREITLGVGQADSEAEGLQGRGLSGQSAECSPIFWPGFIARPGEQQRQWEPPRVIETKRGLGGGINGRSSNVDRLRLLGNGVYPATAMKAFCELIRRHD